MFSLQRVTNCKSMTLVPSQCTKRTVITQCNILYGHSYKELFAYRKKGLSVTIIITVHLYTINQRLPT